MTTYRSEAYRAGLDEFDLSRGATALIVVDMQYASAHPDHGWTRLYREVGMVAEYAYYSARLREIVPRIAGLQEAFRSRQMPVIFLTIGSQMQDFTDLSPRYRRRIDRWVAQGIKPPHAVVGEPGHAVLAELAPRPGEALVNKMTASAFLSTGIDLLLRHRGIKTLVFTGVGTNYCVESTLRDAADLGYDCVLAEDACGAILSEIHERAVESMRPFSCIATTGEILALLANMDRPAGGG